MSVVYLEWSYPIAVNKLLVDMLVTKASLSSRKRETSSRQYAGESHGEPGKLP
jgi:hypothetical protein